MDDAANVATAAQTSHRRCGREEIVMAALYINCTRIGCASEEAN
jgi:hypothetical protein